MISNSSDNNNNNTTTTTTTTNSISSTSNNNNNHDIVDGVDDEALLTTGLDPPFDRNHSIELYHDGFYTKLSNGTTFYQLFEPMLTNTISEQDIKNTYTPRLIRNLNQSLRKSKQTKIVLCLHGLVWWSISYHRLVQSLIDKEFTVLLFDFYGRGRSDAPDMPYSIDNLLLQACELLDRLKIESVYLIGYSMGGAIATQFASTHPQRIIKLCLLGPAIIPVPVPLIAKIITLPYLGKFLFKMVGANNLLYRVENERFANDIADPSKIDSKIIDDLVSKVKWQILEKPSYLDAFHSTLCNIPFSSGLVHLLPHIPSNIPIYIILGGKDMIIPISIAEPTLKQHLPQARIKVIDCGHAFTVEAPDLTSNFVTSFLCE